MPRHNLRRETVTLDELAAVLGIARSTAYDLALHGRLPVAAFRVGRRWLVSRRALDQLLAGDTAPHADAGSDPGGFAD